MSNKFSVLREKNLGKEGGFRGHHGSSKCGFYTDTTLATLLVHNENLPFIMLACVFYIQVQAHECCRACGGVMGKPQALVFTFGVSATYARQADLQDSGRLPASGSHLSTGALGLDVHTKAPSYTGSGGSNPVPIPQAISPSPRLGF